MNAKKGYNSRYGIVKKDSSSVAASEYSWTLNSRYFVAQQDNSIAYYDHKRWYRYVYRMPISPNYFYCCKI